MPHIYTTEHQLSRHANVRCQQRGIRTEQVNLVLAHSDCEHHAGAGATAISVSRQRLRELGADGVRRADLEGLAQLVLVVGGSGEIVTVINHPTRFARFHHGAKRLKARQLRSFR